MQALTDVVVHELVVQARSKPARVFQLVLLDPVQIQLQRAKHTPMGFFEALHKQVRCSEAWMRTHSACVKKVDVRVAPSSDAFPRVSDLVKAATHFGTPWTKNNWIAHRIWKGAATKQKMRYQSSPHANSRSTNSCAASDTNAGLGIKTATGLMLVKDLCRMDRHLAYGGKPRTR